MPNSNPACNPPSDITCDPSEIDKLGEQFQYMCLGGGSEPLEIGYNPSVDPLPGFWDNLSNEDFQAAVYCENDVFKLWVSVNGVEATEDATGGSFPSLTFSGGYSTAGGRC